VAYRNGSDDSQMHLHLISAITMAGTTSGQNCPKSKITFSPYTAFNRRITKQRMLYYTDESKQDGIFLS